MAWTPAQISSSMHNLISGGLSETGAAALVSRWSNVENPGGDPSIWGGYQGRAFGNIQLLGSRRDAFFSFAQDNGLNPNDQNTQDQFALHELNTNTDGSGGLALQRLQSDDPQTAAIGAANYERAAGYRPSVGDYFTGRTLNGIPGVLQTYHDYGGTAGGIDPILSGSASGVNPIFSGQQDFGGFGFSDPASISPLGGGSGFDPSGGYDYGWLSGNAPVDFSGGGSPLANDPGTGALQGSPIDVSGGTGPAGGGDLSGSPADFSGGGTGSLPADTGTVTTPPTATAGGSYGQFGSMSAQDQAYLSGDSPTLDYGAQANAGAAETTSVNTGQYSQAAQTATQTATKSVKGASVKKSQPGQNLTQAVNEQTKQLAANQAAANKTASSNQKAGIQSNQSILAQGETFLNNIFKRGGFIVVGVVFILAGTLGLAFGGGSVIEGVKKAGAAGAKATMI